MKVSVILPAYNEEDSIGEAVGSVSQRLESMGQDYEIIVVDDGSSDGTKSRASEYTLDKKIRVLGYDQNMGKGYALKYGAMCALGDFVFFMDSDLDIEASNLARYLKAVQDVDLVIASKRHPLSKVDEPLSRRVLSFSFNMLVRLLTGVQASDTQAGLKAFSSESMKKILPLLSVKKYAFDVELLVVARLLKMKVVELPVKIQLSAGFSIRSIARMAVDLLGIAYRLRIIHWYQRNINNQTPKYAPIIKW